MREHGTKLYFGTGILKMYSETTEEYRRKKHWLWEKEIRSRIAYIFITIVKRDKNYC